jgi:antitoxin component of MazEF toxin-antitoxin module
MSNRLAVRLPAPVAEALQLKEGDDIGLYKCLADFY